ncbi:helix-turn-helix transcriptional regulator [Streptococcus ruminantium]|uniref:MerR family transcriptional regulator n=1 Tax=Streptococcus ruminantium TaxID=1917441 RepID=A0ABU1B4L0_9STRE|nr:MerR family transcriptional regulator [Streptococcus ruminantium]MDQ8759985.1 MerR family transcriptional regulator [Streptococcus ruminantium]MDQ8765321.1 MerR family transcriptional regulator [Streptococcus ruminantium]MDQ8767896.1 MerR family transcriptional regulator [Streptococcus ruminantium]MDQ8769207.1 MerR family transcriptional regulator [Streptococcus ruminantium]MDQ8775122.1 MerR family transcriptional regulator [Streptococcus ruminantium]
MENQQLARIEEMINLLLVLIQKQSHKHLPILTQKELLQELQISPNTLKKWENQGLQRLEPPFEGTRTVYYKLSDIVDFLEK